MSHEQLAEALIPLSRGSTWEEARHEWELEHIFRQAWRQKCLSGRFPIREICVLRNRLTEQRAEVGNVCVKKFLGLPSDKILTALARVLKAVERAVGPETVEHAHRLRWISDWERHFYLDTWRKRTLTDSQLVKRVEINRRILRRTQRSR